MGVSQISNLENVHPGPSSLFKTALRKNISDSIWMVKNISHSRSSSQIESTFTPDSGMKKIVVSYEHLRCLPWTVTNHEIFIMVPIRYTWYTTVFVPSDQFQLCTSPSGSQTQPQTLWTGASQGIQEWLDKSWNILEPTRNNNHNGMEIIWYTTLYNVM